MAELSVTTATSGLMNIMKTLGDIVEGIVSSLGSLVDGVKGSASTIEKITNEIAQTNVSFAVQLKSFSKELKLLDNYYTKVYMQTKAMVEFGMKESVIPNIKTLINEKDYCMAIKEIRSFLVILARRIKQIIDELNKHEEKVALSQVLQEKIKELTENYEKSKQHLENKVENQKNAECFRIGKNILLLIGASASGAMLLYGSYLAREKLEQATSSVANNPEVLSFITDNGIQGLRTLTSSSEAIHALTIKIEENAQDMSTRFCNFFEKLTKFQIQISTIADNTGELKQYMEELQQQVEDDSDVTGKTATEWGDISVTLQQMFELFENLDREVVQKKISWETNYDMGTSV